jgi:hypothetical protein
MVPVLVFFYIMGIERSIIIGGQEIRNIEQVVYDRKQ